MDIKRDKLFKLFDEIKILISEISEKKVTKDKGTQIDVRFTKNAVEDAVKHYLNLNTVNVKLAKSKEELVTIIKIANKSELLQKRQQQLEHQVTLEQSKQLKEKDEYEMAFKKLSYEEQNTLESYWKDNYNDEMDVNKVTLEVLTLLQSKGLAVQVQSSVDLDEEDTLDENEEEGEDHVTSNEPSVIQNGEEDEEDHEDYHETDNDAMIPKRFSQLFPFQLRVLQIILILPNG